MKEERSIVIKGARVHNLKNIDLELPKGKLVVITGLSGSGKSSLAFDTIYAEGQRRYMESLSSYARHFLGNIEKPDVDMIKGLSPTIAIDQRKGSGNPRSTVGTITEIYDYLRGLFSGIGSPHCPECKLELLQQTPLQIAKKVETITKEGKRYYISAPVIKAQKGEHRHTFLELQKTGYLKVRINNNVMFLTEATDMKLDRNKKHDIDVIFNQVMAGQYSEGSVLDFVKLALDMGNGFMSLVSDDGEEIFFSQFYACPSCGKSMGVIEPRSFSFNSPEGACTKCTGLGNTMVVDAELVLPNKKLSLAEGAIRPWSKLFSNQGSLMKRMDTLALKYKFSMRDPISKLAQKDIKFILNGDEDFEGVVPYLERKFKTTDSDYIRKEVQKYMRQQTCPMCKGKRLKHEFLNVTISGLSIADMVSMSIDEVYEVIVALKQGEPHLLVNKKLKDRQKKIAAQSLDEISQRLNQIIKVGMDYLTLDRSAVTLSGGELQRLRLATQINSMLVDVIYILDEPSVGLHQKDNEKLIHTLKELRDLGNTVIVVEHDGATMEEADLIVDMGPGAGKFGGEIVAIGTCEEIKLNHKSMTGQYLSGELSIEPPKKYRKGNGNNLSIIKASANNLKDIDVDIPLGKFVCVTGVSGSGKSTLVIDILAKALSHYYHRAKALPLEHKSITGLDNIDKVIDIDQSPIGRTPRSNPATYTGVFTYIRDLFVEVPEARIKGLKAGHFSFNVRGGRCEACQGEGMTRIGMQFLQDVYVPCLDCHGSRYNKQVLEIFYKGKNIAEILDMTVTEARRFFGDVPIIYEKLNTLYEVGLGYIHLGQSATTLSGGEAQRIKLATELSHRATGKTLYILDEPTTGLHFEDIKRLLSILEKLVEKGNTVLVIEHNLDVIKSADWVIDMGPYGGKRGGYLVGAGTPKDIANTKESFTGNYLKKILK